MVTKNYKEIILSSITLFFITVLFVLTGYFSNQYQLQIQNYIGNGSFGVLLFIFVNIIAVVVAPISTLPLIPIASIVWGWFFAGMYSIVAWTIGAQIAFYISRKFGKKLVYRIVSIEKIEKLQKRISERNTFWSLVLLRMILPVDILSYAVGLFSTIQSKTFLLATFIGVMPFAFIFAYFGESLGSLSRINIFIAISGILVLMYMVTKVKIKKTEK